MRIVVTSVLVDDQAKALRFYTEVLGFVKKFDVPVGAARWLTVTAPGEPDGTELLLEPDGHPAAKPFKAALVADGIPFTSFAVDDVAAEFERLRGPGRAVRPASRSSTARSRPRCSTTRCGNLIQIAQQAGGARGPDPARRQPAAAARRARRVGHARLPRPAVQHRAARQARRTLATVADPGGDRTGFGGRRYASRLLETSLLPRRVRRLPRVPRARGSPRSTACSRPHGTLYFHIDYREAHYCKLLLDELFGRECFLNELIWAYDYGAKPRNRWPAKHDTILVYVKDPERYLFDADAVDREPYMAPGLVTPEQRERGKRPTDVWWHTIVSPTGREKTGYPTQKPEGIVRRIVQASSRPGDLCLDPFAGSGTLGAVAAAARPPLPADRRLARGGRGDGARGSALRPRPEDPTRTRASASPSGVDGGAPP